MVGGDAAGEDTLLPLGCPEGSVGFATSISVVLGLLGEAKGRMYTPDELTRKFSRALFPRTTNQHGCVTLHSYHFIELRHEVARLIFQ